MTLEDIVEKLFADNPDLNGDEAVRTLKEMKDPKTNKTMWKAATIRNRVDTYLKKKEGVSDTHIESPVPVETKGPGSELKIEGKELERHKPVDPFAIKLEENAEKKVDQMEERQTAFQADTEQFKKGIVDDVSKKVIEQVSSETKSFKEDTISIISDLKSSMVNVITDMKKEMIDIQKQSLPTYEPIVEYSNLKLKQSTIDAIQTTVEENDDLEEESDYIDILIENEKENTSISQVYYKLIDLVKDAKNGVRLKLFYENDRLSYSEEPTGRFGINLKSLIAGICIGIAIGVAIALLYTALTASPPPIIP